MSTPTSIVRRDLAPTTRTAQTVEPARLVADTAELRDDLRATTSQATQLHHDAEELHLAETTRQLEGLSPSTSSTPSPTSCSSRGPCSPASSACRRRPCANGGAAKR